MSTIHHHFKAQEVLWGRLPVVWKDACGLMWKYFENIILEHPNCGQDLNI
jgi:hypothetical protein